MLIGDGNVHNSQLIDYALHVRDKRFRVRSFAHATMVKPFDERLFLNEIARLVCLFNGPPDGDPVCFAPGARFVLFDKTRRHPCGTQA